LCGDIARRGKKGAMPGRAQKNRNASRKHGKKKTKGGKKKKKLKK